MGWGHSKNFFYNHSQMADQGVYIEGNWLNNESYPSTSIVSWTEVIRVQQNTGLESLHERSVCF